MDKKRVKFVLQSKTQPALELKTNPVGWDDKTRKISKKVGIVFDFAEKLTFYGDGYEYIRQAESIEGFDAVILCTKYFLNKHDRYEIEYSGQIDLSKRVKKFNSYQVNLEKGGLELDLKASFNDSYELERLDSIDGKVLPPLNYRNGFLNGRQLLVTSLLENKETVNAFQVGSSNAVLNYIPSLNKVYSGDFDINGVFNLSNGFNTGGDTPPIDGSKAYMSRSFTRKELKLKIKAVADYSFNISVLNGANSSFIVQFLVYKYIDADNPSVFQRVATVQRFDYPGLPSGLNEFSLDLDTDYNLVVEEDEIVFFSFRFFVNGQALPSNEFSITHTNISIESEEDNAYPSTTYEGLTVLDAAKRLSLITFGRNVVQSETLLNGPFKDLLITSGKKLRGFPDSMELSWKNLIESSQKILNIDYGIELVGGVEKIVFREFDEFFRRRSLIDLGYVGDVEEIPTDLNEKVTIGYKEAGEYEEQQGLDEHNTISNFKHNFKSVDGELDLVSEIRADNLAIELTRRKPREDFPTEDTPYDKDNFFIDCYQQSSSYINRNWDKDFKVLPTGIYSPETAFNLRLSPVNTLYRYSNRLTCLSQYPDRKTLFVNAVGNSQLETQLKDVGAVEIDPRLERGDILNSDLLKPLFQPYEATFVYRFSEEQLRYLMKSTDGIPHYYYSLKYTDRNGNINYGFLLEYQPSKEGQIKLIKANYGI
ncbi:hypothetical protein AAU57_11955 [Nonlabens sp. YIK11]|uniref:hypothetical protein n=1 Tax=Nonlabens sp. YIK11 TaxID=1453349 RepID=UPI0006DC3B9B|nr:hypothetical protein [Nonlabens sp. YIK11]KQC33962.1 hypothetical protein AAU57_11955 [Nonlabens sp. YIK11]